MHSKDKESYQGKRVKYIEGDGWNFKASEPETLILHNEYHGEYDNDWVLLLDANGKELKRFNANTLMVIEWL